MKQSLLIKMIYSIPTIGIKFLKYILIFIISLFFLSAPMIHMFTSDKSSSVYLQAKKKYKKGDISKSEYEIIRKKNTYFGYKTKRMLWYAIGMPLLLSYVSIMLMFSSTKLKEDSLKKTIGLIAFCSMLVSFYFLIWAFWYRADFPISWYYICIGVLSLGSAFIVKYLFHFIAYLQNENNKRVKASENFINTGFKLIDLLNEKHVG